MIASITYADITDEEREKIIKEFKKIAANMIKDVNSRRNAVHTEKTTIK